MDPRSKQIIAEAVESSATDPAFFCRFFLSKWFPSEMPPFHLGLLAILTGKVEFLDDYPEAHDFLLTHFRYEPPSNHPNAAKAPVFFLDAEGKMCMHREPNNVLIIPRGYSKTTLNNAANLYVALTENDAVIVYISETATHADNQVNNLRIQLEENDLLRIAYGNQVPTRTDRQKWQDGHLELLSGAVLIGRGRGGQIRGANFDARRPTHIVLDDVEDEESIRTAEQREKSRNWLYGSVLPAGAEMEGDQTLRPMQVTMLGTLLGPDTLLTRATNDPRFGAIRFGARLADGSMLWPYKLGLESYLAKREAFRRVGQLAIFAREYDSVIRVEEDALFPATFIYQPRNRNEFVQVAMALDPAISGKPGADHAAIIVAGRLAQGGGLVMLDEWGGLGKTPREKIDAFFDLHLRWLPDRHGIESVAYQAALIHLMREEQARRGYFFVVTPILQGSDVRKETRVTGMLGPRYKIGVIQHARPLPGLEGNLSDWPNGKKDYADAATMALELLGETGLYAAGDMEKLLGPEHPPLPTVLPKRFASVKGRFITQRSPAQRQLDERYPRS